MAVAQTNEPSRFEMRKSADGLTKKSLLSLEKKVVVASQNGYVVYRKQI